MAVIILGIILALSGGSGGSGPAPRVTGTITLTGGGGYNLSTPCEGYYQAATEVTPTIDYSFFQAGAPVRVLDARGTIIGTGSLSEGTYNGGDSTCTFSFRVPLDRKSPHYQLVMGKYQPYDFTNPSGLALQMTLQ